MGNKQASFQIYRIPANHLLFDLERRTKLSIKLKRTPKAVTKHCWLQTCNSQTSLKCLCHKQILRVPAPVQASLLLSPCSPLSPPQGLVLLSPACSPTEIDGSFGGKRVSNCSFLRKIVCVDKQYFWPSLSSQNNCLLFGKRK